MSMDKVGNKDNFFTPKFGKKSTGWNIFTIFVSKINLNLFIF